MDLPPPPTSVAMMSRISTVPLKLNLSFFEPALSRTATPPPDLINLSMSSNPVIFLPETLDDWRFTIMSLSSKRNSVQWRLLIPVVADELAVETDETEADVEA